MPSQEAAKKTSTERGVITASVSTVQYGSGSVSVTIWGRDMGFVGVNVKKYGGGARGIPQAGDGSEVQAAEGQYLKKRRSGKGTQ